MTRERELLERVISGDDAGDFFIGYRLYKDIETFLDQPEQEPKFNFDLERMKAAIESPISDVTVDDLAKQVSPRDFNFYSHMFESAYVRSIREELVRSINEANKRESKDTEDKLQDLATYGVSFSKGGKRIDPSHVYISNEPTTEPVAWMNDSGGCFLSDGNKYSENWTPLYTEPPKRKPLSEDKLDVLAEANTTDEGIAGYYLGFRDAEKYHNIRGGE